MRDAFSADFGSRVFSTIEGPELLQHVEERTGTASTFNRRAETLRAFGNWCAKAPRSWCDPKVTELLEKRETSR